MLSSLIQQGTPFLRPEVDFHAFAPEIILVGTIVVVLLADLFTPEGGRAILPSLAGIGLLASLVPILTLALDGTDRAMFGGAYAVDDFSLVLKALFLIAGYVVVLLSTNYIAEGDYAEGEYYFLLLASILGMTIMASARDLVSIFIALELLSIPAYMLAGWRKRDLHGNEAGVKYYLMGVFASAVMLYGMSLLYGLSGSTLLSDIAVTVGSGDTSPIVTLAVVLLIVGFGFKVSAVPFHTWAPDVYEGAPTPITAFLAVSSKAAGFVALLQLILIAFIGRTDVVGPLMWVLAALTMTVGNLIALRQTNIIRMLAYSGVAQAGFMLAPLAVVGTNPAGALRAVVTYLLIYAAMNLGAFAVVLAVARKTRSAEIDTWGGLFEYAP
ncbi:MAG TPA: NADH-quinone oxidoreductase subunit N, partial [Acidimicrobiales bacterium]